MMNGGHSSARISKFGENESVPELDLGVGINRSVYWLKQNHKVLLKLWVHYGCS